MTWDCIWRLYFAKWEDHVRELGHVIKSQCDINSSWGPTPPALLSRHASLGQCGFTVITWDSENMSHKYIPSLQLCRPFLSLCFHLNNLWSITANIWGNKRVGCTLPSKGSYQPQEFFHINKLKVILFVQHTTIPALVSVSRRSEGPSAETLGVRHTVVSLISAHQWWHANTQVDEHQLAM